jgi:thiamine pyrophosphokinase
MKRAVIFANGRMETPPPFIKEIHESDVIIAADGGTQHCKSLSIMPNVIIGDLDSIDSKDLAIYQQAGVKIIQHPSHKDETDLELALLLTVKYEITQVYVIGALGARWDMTIANVLILANPEFSRLSIHLLDGSQELIILRGKSQLNINGKPGAMISLIPISGDVPGITTQGLEYALRNETLSFGATRGVSNVFANDHAELSVTDGILLICLDYHQ